MELKYVKVGSSLDYTLTAEVATGDPIVLGDLVVVAKSGGAIGDKIAVAVTGVWRVPKTLGVGSGYPIGTKLYWDPATGKATETAGALKLMGYAAATAADADITTDVRLIG